MAADHRSAHPNIPGVPWWGAVLIAITASAIGFAFDAGAGSKQLSAVFAGCYVLGCVLAVLAVRQAAVFTAVIQPPLVLFVTVPTAYFLFTSGQIEGLKDLAINCGYPLIERFPLMFFTSAGVLLIGMLRWYVGLATRRAAPAQEDDAVEPATGFAAALTAKLSGLFARDDDDEAEEVPPPPRRRRPASERATSSRASADRAARRDRATGTRAERPTKRAAPSRSRHVRPPETEIIDPVAERPRRSRSSRQREAPPPEPRRRPRTSNPRQPGPPPSERRSRYDRNGYERTGYERTGYERPERRRFDDYQPREPHSSNGNSNGTHHPVSRVRYRGEDSDERAQYRTSRRGGWEAESWEYDV